MQDELRNKKEVLEGVFTRTAESYANIRSFPIFGQWLVETANIPAGSTVLDVASGRGAVLFPAAERVGPQGHVIGTDLAPGMANKTGAEIERRGLKQAEFRQMDAEHLQFPDESFDFVLCGFALQFFPHLDQALSEFRRVLKPAGHVAATIWGDDDERWDWFQDLRASHGAVLKLGSQSFDGPDEIRGWFTRAGFADIAIHSKELDMIYANEEEWWNVEWSISGRAGLEKLSPQGLRDLKAAAFEKLRPQKQPDGFHYQLKAFCTTAAKA